MLLKRRMKNFRKLAQLEIPKNRGELLNDVNIAKSKNWKNGKNSRNFSKLKKYIYIVIGTVIMKAHAKFQEASSIGNTQKSRGTVQ